ncbi:septal ring lytic transglycosylase RlpA family protein [Lacibacter luteus]|uniref:Probable endolytic peptidoglycan transglycosylase RlpA n=1 Tax=Lacibacter luteus TaxID=2508719 RepID=A0A4V1M754_9BACT|nr:septal ring lytic transglycosylase RlpA family protein [Lacibacter luteus]RXK58350.1 septal ring lytic transglycosylase RlpA family protein [Lacibacter luteus]
MPKPLFVVGLFFLFFHVTAIAQQDSSKPTKKATGKSKIQYGLASFYSNKFNGRKTANGEIFSQQKLTAAHNTLPLGTYVRVTNLRNGKTVVVKINDRLHHRNKRIIDLTRAAATKLGFIKSGLTRVKIEVLGKKPVSR